MTTLLARPRVSLSILLTLLVITTSGCDSSEPGGSTPDIAGSWSGVATFNAGFTTRMELDQRGRSVSGTADLPSRRGTVIEGEINANDRFAWEVQVGCEHWSGSLAIDEDAQEMSGSINLDGGSCSPASSANGTLRLSR